MRALLPLLGLPLALALWAGSLWWGLPYAVSLRLEPRAQPPVTTPGPPDVWRLEVTRTFPHLEALALGDRVQFDRYGLLAPTRGSVRCLPVAQALLITPLGGRIDHAGHLERTRVPAATPGCEPPGLEPVVSLHP